MKIGMVGLGKMGANMAKRLLRGGHNVAVYDTNPEAVRAMADDGAKGFDDLEELICALTPPRAVWVMVPSGAPTDATFEALSRLLSTGDIAVDGGNSYYKNSISRASTLAEKGIRFVDAGTSGGIWGLSEGYCLMVGGDPETVEILKPILETLAPAPDRGWARVGPNGAGHFVKMVHNGVEYGLMQAYAEGFSLMEKKKEFNLDLGSIAELWRHGSVVRSWLLDLSAEALSDNPRLSDIAGFVPDSGEGRWTVQEAIDLGCPLPVISLSLQNRFRSRENEFFGDKLLSAMRGKFGGHDVKKES